MKGFRSVVAGGDLRSPGSSVSEITSRDIQSSLQMKDVLETGAGLQGRDTFVSCRGPVSFVLQCGTGLFESLHAGGLAISQLLIGRVVFLGKELPYTGHFGAFLRPGAGGREICRREGKTRATDVLWRRMLVLGI